MPQCFLQKAKPLSQRRSLLRVQGKLCVVGPPNCQAEIIRFRGTEEAPGLLSQGATATRLAPLFLPQVLEPALESAPPKTPTHNNGVGPHSVRGRNTNRTFKPLQSVYVLEFGMASYTPSTRRLTSTASFSSWPCSLSHPHSLAARALSGKSKIMRAHVAPPKLSV